jgi:hypothetical protein
VATGAAPALHDGGQAHRIWRTAAVALLVVGVIVDLVTLGPALATAQGYILGGDFVLYRDSASRWLADGGFYWPYQLVGPYPVVAAEILYPPVVLALCLPFTVLPAVLWWILPLWAIVGAIYYWRPRPWALGAIAICAGSYPSIVILHQGNPVIWISAFLALGTRWPAYSALVLLKPSLFPFALLGARHRGWWIVTAVLAAMSLLLLPMTLDWLHALLNISGGRSGLLYSWPEIPVVAIPLVAWAGRHREGRPSLKQARVSVYDRRADGGRPAEDPLAAGD